MSKLSRRTFLMGTLGAIPAVGLAKSFNMESNRPLLPKIMKPGDRMGIVAPASAGNGAEELETVKSLVTSLGFEPVLGSHVLDRFAYLAGTDEARAADLNAFFNNDSIAGILCLRGGYGTPRLLPHLDYKAFRANPKPVIGYSDITGLLNALTRKTGVVTFHGPVGISVWEDFDREWFRKVCLTAEPAGIFATSNRPVTPVSETIASGTAKGKLFGGNLSLVSAVLGSEYAPPLKGTILFLEEIGEDPYRVDRMLTHLLLQPDAKKLAGIAIGSFRYRSGQQEALDPAKDWTLEDVLRDRLKEFGCPVATGFQFGHVSDQVFLPIGATARLDAEAKTLEVLSAAVRE